MTAARPRTAGLDTLRAGAIVLVFMYHYMCFVSGEPTFGWASEIGWTGVDLFFVLSGFLIANPLFAGLQRGRRLSLPRFYARRAMRTLPVFWLVLAAYALFPAAMGGLAPPALWRFLSFTQNIGLQPGTAFSQAWSLCIEEQFYLVLPAVVAAGAFFGTRGTRLDRRHGWALLAALTATGIAVRATLWFTYGRKSGGQVDGYMTHVYYATLCRFDEFIPGIALAMLRNFHRPLWDRAMAHGRLLFAAGVLAVAAMGVVADRGYWITGYGYGFFMTAFGYTLLAMSFALLVAAAQSPAAPLHRLRIPGAERIALWSYSIYLSHKPVAHLLADLLRPLGVSPGLLLAAIAVASVGVGALLHTLVEVPFMALRDAWFPSNFGGAKPERASPPAAPEPPALSASQGR